VSPAHETQPYLDPEIEAYVYAVLHVNAVKDDMSILSALVLELDADAQVLI